MSNGRRLHIAVVQQLEMLDQHNKMYAIRHVNVKHLLNMLNA